MFLNYFRIQLIRAFKGKEIFPALIPATIFSLMMVLVAFLLHLAVMAYPDNFPEEVTDKLTDFTFIQDILLQFGMCYVFPIAIGIGIILFVKNYYTTRSYINVDISMRNKTLYCLSELFLAGLLATTLAVFVLCLSLLVAPLELGQSYIVTRPRELFEDFVTSWVVMLEHVTVAYFLAKMLRKKLISIVIFVVYSEACIILGSMVEHLSGLKQLSLLMFANPESFYMAEEDQTTNLLFGNQGYIYVGLSILRIAALFIGAVLLFRRKYEEKAR